MKKLIAVNFTLLIFSCSTKKTECEEYSSAYWTTTVLGKSHNTRITGENVIIRKAFSEIQKVGETTQKQKRIT